MKRANFELRRAARKESADERAKERAARGDAGQVARLDAAGERALRERRRLAARKKGDAK